MQRDTRQGLVTITALAAVLLLAVLTLTLQTRTASDLRLIARLVDDIESRTAKDSIFDRLRPLIAIAMANARGTLVLDGTPLVLTETGRVWEVRVQDVEGQIDLYLAPPDLLALLPIPPESGNLRERELAQLPPGARFPVLAMSAARFGISSPSIIGLITQSASTGMLRLRTAPAQLNTAGFFAGPREAEQVTLVAISIQEVLQ